MIRLLMICSLLKLVNHFGANNLVPQAQPFYLLNSWVASAAYFCGRGIFIKIISVLYYKTVTIVKMTIISDATIWSVTYDCN
jgi:hypothetical protein